MLFQSLELSPSNRQIASSVVFTAWGGLAIDRISTKSFFLIDFTATIQSQVLPILLRLATLTENVKPEVSFILSLPK